MLSIFRNYKTYKRISANAVHHDVTKRFFKNGMKNAYINPRAFFHINIFADVVIDEKTLFEKFPGYKNVCQKIETNFYTADVLLPEREDGSHVVIRAYECFCNRWAALEVLGVVKEMIKSKHLSNVSYKFQLVLP